MMRWFWSILMLVILLPGCVVLPRAFHGDPAPACPAEKIYFTQDTGCLNDGSVEFCIPADDAALLAQVRDLAPGVQCVKAGGRAGCDLVSERLCMVETAGLCVERHGALTDAGWALICDLAALEPVRGIVPTWYE